MAKEAAMRITVFHIPDKDNGDGHHKGLKEVREVEGILPVFVGERVNLHGTVYGTLICAVIAVSLDVYKTEGLRQIVDLAQVA
jgi:hypothetical protein